MEKGEHGHGPKPRVHGIGQDVSTNDWWENIPDANIQVTSPAMANSWKSNIADIVCDMMVIGYYGEKESE